MELSNPPRTRSNEAFFVSNFWIFLVGCDRVRLWHLVTTSEGFAVGVVMGNMPINKYLFHYLLTCLFIWKPEESSTLSANDRQVEQTRNTRETSSQKEYLLRKTETHHSLQQLPGEELPNLLGVQEAGVELLKQPQLPRGSSHVQKKEEELVSRCGRRNALLLPGKWTSSLEMKKQRSWLPKRITNGYALLTLTFQGFCDCLLGFILFEGFPAGLEGKESTCNAADMGLLPGLGRSPREGNGYPLQDSGLENSTDRGAWWGLQSTRLQRGRHNWVTQLSDWIKEINLNTIHICSRPPFKAVFLTPGDIKVNLQESCSCELWGKWGCAHNQPHRQAGKKSNDVRLRTKD